MQGIAGGTDIALELYSELHEGSPLRATLVNSRILVNANKLKRSSSFGKVKVSTLVINPLIGKGTTVI